METTTPQMRHHQFARRLQIPVIAKTARKRRLLFLGQERKTVHRLDIGSRLPAVEGS